MREPKDNIRASRRLLRQGGTSGQSQERAAAAAGAGGSSRQQGVGISAAFPLIHATHSS